jgi:hypothetical protein
MHALSRRHPATLLKSSPRDSLMFRTAAVAVAVLAAIDSWKFDGAYLNVVEQMIAVLLHLF